jgi:hypothetical protein
MFTKLLRMTAANVDAGCNQFAIMFDVCFTNAIT